MNDARTRQTVHIPGTLSANATGVIPMWATRGGTLLEVSACSSADSPATLMLGVRGDSPDADGIMTAKAIGVSGVPRIFKVADFDGVLADPIRSSHPRFNKQTVLTWTLNFNGPEVNEVQTVTITGAPTGGTFTLTYSGQTTSGIAYNASAATVQTALEALSNIAPGDVVVTGAAGGPYTVTFGGLLVETNVAEMTASAASLTGGTTPAVAIATTTAGAAAGTAAANVDINFTVLIGGAVSAVTGF